MTCNNENCTASPVQLHNCNSYAIRCGTCGKSFPLAVAYQGHKEGRDSEAIERAWHYWETQITLQQIGETK